MRIVLVYSNIFLLGGGQNFSAQKSGGDKISVHRYKGGTKFQCTAILEKHQPPPPINNDRPPIARGLLY